MTKKFFLFSALAFFVLFSGCGGEGGRISKEYFRFEVDPSGALLINGNSLGQEVTYKQLVSVLGEPDDIERIRYLSDDRYSWTHLGINAFFDEERELAKRIALLMHKRDPIHDDHPDMQFFNGTIHLSTGVITRDTVNRDVGALGFRRHPVGEFGFYRKGLEKTLIETSADLPDEKVKRIVIMFFDH